MLNEKEIARQIAEDEQRWNDAVYDGFLPQLFLDYFRKAMMILPPAQHKYNMAFVKTMINRKPDEVTNLEVGMMINIIYHCPFGEIYNSIEEAIDITMEFDKVRFEYNQKTEAINTSLNRKRAKLHEIAGIGGKTVDFSKKNMPQA
jgi:hypothetical protein